mmetsp:Transcript_18412/g.46646  ORF Transcript_18412/g.46646 Transcript_18412/m.46646 type:complete len:218 (-) Transcript_18412:163-816(-)
MHARLRRLHSHHLDIRVLLREEAACTSNGSTCTHASNEVVHLAAGLLPDLRSSGGVVDVGIGLVVELVGQEVVRVGSHQRLGVSSQAWEALGRRRQVYLSSELTTDGVALLEGRQLWHDDDALVAFRGADHGQPDASVAARVLYHSATRLQLALGLSCLDHALGDAVLYRSSRVLHLHLAQYRRAIGAHFLRQRALQAHQRGVADCLKVTRHPCLFC